MAEEPNNDTGAPLAMPQLVHLSEADAPPTCMIHTGDWGQEPCAICTKCQKRADAPGVSALLYYGACKSTAP
jgi:hypothetical protein